MPNILAIDPGKTGAIAVLNQAGALIEVQDMPPGLDPVGIATLLHDLVARHAPAYAAVERTHGRPGRSAVAMHGLGMASGLVLGVLAALRVPVVLLLPAHWKRRVGVTADKTSSLEMARLLWPDMAALFRRKRDDGRAEAALIGLAQLQAGGVKLTGMHPQERNWLLFERPA